MKNSKPNEKPMKITGDGKKRNTEEWFKYLNSQIPVKNLMKFLSEK